MAKKIGIVSLGYGWLPCEPGPSRFYYICKMFAENGWDVELITGDFQHFEKKYRDTEKIRSQNYPFQISFIHVPAYKKNIDPRRVYSNRISAQNTIKHLSHNQYDAIYCSIPANDVAAKVGKYCSQKEIPFIVDIEDLWPEAMEMAVHNKWLRKLIFPYFMRDAEAAYACADAVVGTSQDYTERATLYNHRSIPSKTVYVGCDLKQFDTGVKEYEAEIIKPENEFWVTYAGSIGTSYDIRTMVLAGKALMNAGRDNIRIKILGTGPQKEELEQLSKDLNCTNVEFLGYIPYPKMAAYLTKSDVVVNSFVKGAPQSIVNKVGDYLASGKPIINTLENPVFCRLVAENDVGINIEPGNVTALQNAVERYLNDTENCKNTGKKARQLAEQKFDRDVAYKEILYSVRNCTNS